YVAPHHRVGRGNTLEIAKAAGRKLDHFAVRYASEVSGRIDDVVGDQMRDVAGDRKHQVMMLGRHDLDLRPEPLPERLELGQRHAVGIRLWRQDAPSSVEEFREARFGT